MVNDSYSEYLRLIELNDGVGIDGTPPYMEDYWSMKGSDFRALSLGMLSGHLIKKGIHSKELIMSGQSFSTEPECEVKSEMWGMW